MRATHKKFDCLKMKQDVQTKLWSKLRGMSLEKQLAWWKEREAETQQQLEAQRSQTIK